MPTLGCGSHYAAVRDVVTGATVCSLDRLYSVRWQRIIDDVSSAEVEVATNDCCECLEKLRTWRHELVIYRNGTEVWSGPLMRIEMTRETALLYAWDHGVWLSRRMVRTDAELTLDASLMAERVVRDAFAVDDRPGFLDTMEVRLADLEESRTFRPGQETVLDVLQDLSRGAIDFTVLGRRLVIGGEFGFGNLGRLTDEDFSEELRVIEDGFSLATAATVVGRDEVSGEAGGVDAYYGLVEQLDSDGGDSVATDAEAEQAATAYLEGRYPSPLYVATPRGESLTPRAAVDFNGLVPGMLTTISAGNVCRPVSTVFKLTFVEITEFPDEGEVVAVSFAPKDAPADFIGLR